MPVNDTLFPVEKYQVTTNIYNGPLDLLLHLIEKAELDITKLALAQVTDQYIAFLNNLTDKDAAEISYFLIVAAKLVQIKSEALLPAPPVRRPDEEDPGETLAAQLIIYKMFKESSKHLAIREEQKLSTYLHIPPQFKVEGIIDLTGITVNDLAEAARIELLNVSEKTFGSRVIQIPRFSIREKIGVIISALQETKSLSFQTLLGTNSSRLEAIVTFLALLELVKQNFILPHQEKLFSDITITAAAEVPLDQQYDLEFGE